MATSQSTLGTLNWGKREVGLCCICLWFLTVKIWDFRIGTHRSMAYNLQSKSLTLAFQFLVLKCPTEREPGGWGGWFPEPWQTVWGGDKPMPKVKFRNQEVICDSRECSYRRMFFFLLLLFVLFFT